MDTGGIYYNLVSYNTIHNYTHNSYHVYIVALGSVFIVVEENIFFCIKQYGLHTKAYGVQVFISCLVYKFSYFIHIHDLCNRDIIYLHYTNRHKLQVK